MVGKGKDPFLAVVQLGADLKAVHPRRGQIDVGTEAIAHEHHLHGGALGPGGRGDLEGGVVIS